MNAVPRTAVFLFFWSVWLWFPGAFCSPGDQSPYYRRCIQRCLNERCLQDKLEDFYASRPWYLALTGWECADECSYDCMWKTSDHLRRSGLRPQQFHGKWPFVRFLGIQEPASAFFSLLNLVPHAIMIFKLPQLVPSRTPMLKIWQLYALVSIHTWFWSAVFHTRDVDFTEKMDYFCAFSVVVYSMMAFFLRVFETNSRASLFCCTFCLFIFVGHIWSMAFVHFDYGHNMRVNIAVGAVNSICWLAWCYKFRDTRKHSRKAATAVLLLNVSMLLELMEFEPILSIFDSHALWHLSTSPIHYIWYRFVVEDCKHLSDTQGPEKLIKTA